ncbi:MAG: hypothetical protein AAF799_32790 [Myxococcota bacterium]
MRTRLIPLVILSTLPAFGCVEPGSSEDLEALSFDDDLDSDGSEPFGDLVDEPDPLGAPAPAPIEPGTFPTPLPPQWVLGSNTVNVEWNSGKTVSLSSWQKLRCVTDHGPGFLLTRLRAFREPASNWDNFTARLRGTCSRYADDDGDFVQTGEHITEDIFAGNHRSPGQTTSVEAADDYPVGVLIETAPGDGYAKTFRLITVSEQADGSLGDYDDPDYTPGVPDINVFPIIGPLHWLQCPDQHVVSGLQLKYDTRNAKIRRLRVRCRSLTQQ